MPWYGDERDRVERMIASRKRREAWMRSKGIVEGSAKWYRLLYRR